ncbi:MAG: transglycosylase SLT domain-containing protein [Granulosicoccus sp.]
MVDLAMITACLVLGADPGLISAIIETESAGKIAALNINQWQGDALNLTDTATAISAAKLFIDEGYTVDVGLMGINSENINRFNKSVEEAFEPCTNIELGEHILMQNIESANAAGLQADHAIRAALSLYNTGSLSAGFTNGYVQKVWSRYQGNERIRAQLADSRVEWTHGPSWSDEVTASAQLWRDPDE